MYLSYLFIRLLSYFIRNIGLPLTLFFNKIKQTFGYILFFLLLKMK